MHRNTLLLVSLLAVVAALLVGIRIGQRLVTQNALAPSPTLAPTSTPRPTITLEFTSSSCGVSLQYPDSLSRLDSTNSAMFVSTTNATDSVALVCQRNMPRPSVASGSAETITVASLSARLYHDTSGTNKQPIDKIIFTNPKNGLDVLIAGLGTTFQAMVSSIKLTP